MRCPRTYLSTLCGLFLLTAPPVTAQMFDMSDGNDEGLVFPCKNGAVGQWKEEQASLYPGGPSSGLVLSSDPNSGSCLELPQPVRISRDSQFHLHARIEYGNSWDKMTVWIIDEDDEWQEWFSEAGSLGWVTISRAVPSNVVLNQERYQIYIWDSSSSHSMSIRYFEITEEDLVVTTPGLANTTVTELMTSTPLEVSSTPSLTSPQQTTDLTTSSLVTDDATLSSSQTTQHSTSPDPTLSSPLTTEDEQTSDSLVTSSSPQTTESHEDITTTYIKTTTTAETLTSAQTNITESSTPVRTTGSSPTLAPPPEPGRVLSGWGVALGIVIGVLLMGALFCCWWALIACLRRRRKQVPVKKHYEQTSLPRLEVVSGPPSYRSQGSVAPSTFTITARAPGGAWPPNATSRNWHGV